MHANSQALLRIAVCVAVGLVRCAAGAIGDEVTISGTVLTPDGQPAAGAKVVASWGFQGAPEPKVLVDAVCAEDGSFHLRAVADGDAAEAGSIQAIKDGYGLGWTRVTNQQAADCTIRLNVEELLKGDVHTLDGAPIAGADLRVKYVQAGKAPDGVLVEEGLVTTSGEDGAFTLHGLPEGAICNVFVAADGYARARWEARGVGHDGLLHVTLQPEAAIAGTIAREGQPAGGIRVGAQGTNASRISPATRDGGTSPEWGEAVSDETGRYRIEGLYEGTYNVCLDLGDDAEWAAVAHEGVRCTPGAVIEGVDFTLIKGGLVTGTVTNAETGEAIANAWVACYGPARPMSQAWCQSTRTDDQGRYTFRLPPGQNKVYMGETDGKPDPPQHMVEVADGQPTEGVDFTVVPPLKIECVVIDQDGQPVSGGIVSFIDFRMRNSFQGPAKLDELGRLSINLVTDASARDEQSVMVTDADGARVGFGKLDPRATVLTVEMAAGGTVTGRIVDAGGAGLAGVGMRCLQMPGVEERIVRMISLPGEVATDADGRFTMKGLPPDTALAVLSVGQEQQYTRESEWPDTVTLEPGETRDIGTATVDRAGLKLKGRTLDAERNLLAGCTVIDVTSDRRAVSDAEGAFELSGLPYKGAGRCLLAMHPDQPLFCIEANADPTVDRALDLVLEPLGSVCGRLLDAEGKPLVGWRVGVQASGMMVVGEGQYADAAQRGARVQTWGETDANGAWCVDGVVCGAAYWVSSYDAEVAQGRPKRFWHDTFVPRAAEAVDFGDVTVK